MWLFTEAADKFDRMRADNEKFLDVYFTRWVAHAMKDQTSSLEAGLIYAGVGALYAVHKFTTEVAASYVDVARLGDGITKEKSGWGVAKDALRATVVVSGVLRGGRVVLGAMKQVDMFAGMGNCSWVAAAKVARFSGVRLFARITDLAGMPRFRQWKALVDMTARLEQQGRYAEAAAAAARQGSTGGAWVRTVARHLGRLGARVTHLGDRFSHAFNDMKHVMEVARKHPNASVLFSVRWRLVDKAGRFVMDSEGKVQWVAHTMIARRILGGGVRIYDRSGMVVKSLVELERAYGAGIGSAETIGSGAIVHNTIVVQALEKVPSVIHLLAFEAIPVVIGKPKKLTPRGGGSRAKSSGRKPQPRSMELHEDEVWQPTTDGGSVFRGVDKYWTYTVQPGDSLASISQTVFGKPGQERRIYELNQRVIGPPPKYLIHPGQQLRLPD